MGTGWGDGGGVAGDVAVDGAWLTVWAKSRVDELRRVSQWLSLQQHLDDAQGVAELLVDEWLSAQVRARVGRELPGGVAGVRAVAGWLAGVHDVGKASPAFAVQVKPLAERMRAAGLGLSPLLAGDVDRRLAPHALVGQIALQEWLVWRGFAKQAATGWAVVVGSHHGVPPERGQVAEAIMRPELVGGGGWKQVRWQFLDRAECRALPGGVTELRDVRLSKPSQALLTAVVILADWIASSDLFPLRPIEDLDPVEPDDAVTAARVADAWRELALPRPWRPDAVDHAPQELFRRRFCRIESMRAAQVAAVEAARAMAEPGLLVVEAPMGSGKTEAALLAAEVLAEKFGADGCFVALPTQATSDAMFARVRAWVERAAGGASVSLAHGRAHLNDDYQGLLRAGRFARIGDHPEEEAVAHWWLRGRKKAALAAFVVGTIDQVLFAGLKSRHLMLRHLALAGKVVIIDEVHAYDVYMSQYLHRVLQWLGAYRVPVVLLSATLPDARRQELMAAYRGQTPGPPDHPGYPVVSATGAPARTVPLPESVVEVSLDRLADDLPALADYLRHHLDGGGCAAVVRNTVGRVQDTAQFLAEQFGAENVTINHSRFLACDRAAIDRDLLARFGPDGESRPAFHIVVASQVLEQSLDVDFDLMVIDLAPVDLVLQRLGRLHRHRRRRAPGVTQARCAVVGVEDWSAAPITPVRGSVRVYGRHLLLRAGALLVERATVRLPHDIAPLVQLAYGEEQLGEPEWRADMHAAAVEAHELEQRRVTAAGEFLLDAPEGANLMSWVRAGVGDTDDSARGRGQVRDGLETLEVLVVQQDEDGGLMVVDWAPRHAGAQIPLDQEVPWPVARTIATCTVRLPPALSHEGVIDAVIAELEQNYVTSFDRHPLLGGQLVLPLDQHRQTVLHGRQLTYDLRRGLLHEPA